MNTGDLPFGALSAMASLLPATRSGRLLTLIYHRVRPQLDPMFPGEVTTDQFDEQMRLLKRYCQPMRLPDAVQCLRDDVLPSRAVAVTFDDGYRDNAEHALPILREHGISATFFVATSYLGTGIMWNDAVVEALRSTRRERLELQELGVQAAVPASQEQRGALAEQIIRRIKHLPQAKRTELSRQVVAHCGAVLPHDLMMRPEDVRHLHEAGMEIGAHTRTHPILSVLDQDAVKAEMSGSRQDLEKLIGADVTAFAYPNGRPGEDYGSRECRIAREAGFRFAMSTRWGVANAASDLYQLPRFTPWDSRPTRWLARLLLQFRNVA